MNVVKIPVDKKFPKKGIETTGGVYKVYINGINQFTCYSHPDNCKHISFDSIGYLLNTEKKVKSVFKRLEEIDKSFSRKTVFTVSLMNKEDIDIIKEKYDLVYAVEVPIGYEEDEPHYYCMFKFNHIDLEEIEERIDEFVKKPVIAIND